MNYDELNAIATELYGTSRWKVKLARDLEMNERTFKRYMHGETIRKVIELAVLRLRDTTVATTEVATSRHEKPQQG